MTSSRDNLAGAGWTCQRRGRFAAFVPPKPPLSWLKPRILWESRNDTGAEKLADPINDLRRAWVSAALGDGGASLSIDRTGSGDVSFLVVGDPGEGDASQWATVPALRSMWGDAGFMVLASDVIYPAGCSDEYEEKFYRPYRDFTGPIYAVPGNHDWYDELQGFMFHLCGVERRAAPEWTFMRGMSSWKRRLHRLLWRKPRPPAASAAAVRQTWRPRDSQRSGQGTPYWAIETDHLRIVGIDTGIRGDIDRDQGRWLREISQDPSRPKILVTGKPIYVDNEYRPGPIEGGGTVDDIVRAPEHGYLAAIGGDIHNYQRYPVDVGHGRVIQYVVSGGGGAFMHETHKIPRIDLPGVNEEDFVCYPRRGDSLSLFSKLYDRRLGLGRGYFEIRPDEASTLMAKRLGIDPEREGDQQTIVPERARRAAEKILPLPGRAHGPLHGLFSVFFDWNDPPMFKSFLRLDVADGRLRLRCLAATGCLEHEDHPPVEDEIVAERAGDAGDGVWRWRRVKAGERSPGSAPLRS
ncbi:MAG TPA: metallophosphoesterase [Solirubrobacteraceae bacterium]|nr:metallophosphoesterase [Solirubrobacteraceae bacterium]